MAYGRTYRTSGYKYGKRSRLRRKYGVSSYRTVKMTVPRVRKIIQNVAEIKYFDGNILDTTVGATWEFNSNLLGGIVQGTTATNRIGNKILVRKITVNVIISGEPVATFTQGVMTRVVLVHDKACNGRVITFDDVFAYDHVASTRATPYTTAVTIVKDSNASNSIATATSTGAPAAATGPRMFKWVIKPNKVVDYVANTGSVADLLKHNWAIGYNSSATNNSFIRYFWKIEFSDV